MEPEEMEREKEALKESVIASRMMADMMQYHERENKRLWCAVVALAAVFAIMAGCMVWTIANAQKVANEAMLNALNTVAEIGVTQEETTTTTVMQDTGEGSSNNVYQSGESATYNEAASSSAENGE